MLKSVAFSLRKMGPHETGLARVIRSGYDLLHLITFHRRPQGSTRGLCIWGPRPRKPLVKSTPTCSAASSAPKPLPSMISWHWAASAAQDAGKLRQEGKE